MSKTNYKKFLSESLMIILSVLIALFVTECRNNVLEDQKTLEILENVEREIAENKAKIETERGHHQTIVHNIDSLRELPSFVDSIWDGEMLYLRKVAPRGFFQSIIRDVAWQVALQNDVTARVDFDISAILFEVYNQQEFVLESNMDILDILSQREIQRKEYAVENLKLLAKQLSENVGRENKLLLLYDQALTELSDRK